MSTDTSADRLPRQRRAADVTTLTRFAVVALPTGWVLLTLPLVLHQPFEPFVLATLVLGLIVPAVVLVRRDPGRSVRADLLRDCWRLPKPLWLLAPALLVLPALTWSAAEARDAAVLLTSSLLTGSAVNVVSSLLIVNLWEEMVWAGFVQRRAMHRWGYLRGSLLTAVLFASVHAPLAFADARDAGDVACNTIILVGSAIGLRLLIGMLDLRSGGSILLAAVVHASFNAAALFVDPQQDWIRYVVVVGLGTLAAARFCLTRNRPL